MANPTLQTQPQQSAEGAQKPSKRRSDLAIDLLGVAGLGSVGFGIYQISEPWAFIVVGAAVFMLALLASRG